MIIVLVAIVTYVIGAQNDIVVLNKKNNGANHTVPLNTYEEFFIEHSISTADARQSFRENYNVLMKGKYANQLVSALYILFDGDHDHFLNS